LGGVAAAREGIVVVNEHSEDAAGDQSVEDAGSDASVAGDQNVDGRTDAADPQPQPPVTGEPGVDDALKRLSEIDDLPTADHVEVYDEVHQRLSDILADSDED
jgi:hypothetical protein